MKKNIRFFCLLMFIFIISMKNSVLAQENKYVTVVIPLRGREYWHETKNVTPLFEFLKKENIPHTVLFQYQALNDKEVTGYFKKLQSKSEYGIFLEVDESLANDSMSSYLYGQDDRANANKILLSGYEVNERKRIIDKVFNRFHNIFGFYPRSVGAWYIDAVSQEYLRQKYKIKSILDVADQYETDTYGLWGKPWGISFIPSRLNPLIPFQDIRDNSQIVKIQWAARDPVKGYGISVNDSTYSIQANDYISFQGYNIDYFVHLADIYLDSNSLNNINQLTVGLEAGQEGNQFLEEFTKEINVLKKSNFVTMREFADIFLLNQGQDTYSVVRGSDYKDKKTKGIWFNFSKYRAYLLSEKNKLVFKDIRAYNNQYFYSDVINKDISKNLKRIVKSCIDNARFGQNMLLADDVKLFDIEKSEDGFIIQMEKNSGGKIVYYIHEDGISLGNKYIFKAEKSLFEKNILTDNFFDLVVTFQAKKSSNVRILPVFSEIQGGLYFGIPLYPDRVLSLTSKYPFIGIFKFPFQVLSKFKKVDLSSFLEVFLLSFVNPSINCKIKL